jgi:Holliday junction resolvase RusA-like endonuclease
MRRWRGVGTVRIDVFIGGIPYSQKKVRGDREAADRWTQSIIQTTKNLPKVKGPVSMSLKFVLPADKYPLDHPYGPDLDNLVKRLLDALNMTVLANAPGMDGAVVRLLAKKRKASKSEQTGVRMILNEL